MTFSRPTERTASARRLLARVTGPEAITWWSWIVTAPFALTVMSGFQYVHGGPAEALAVAALQHGVVGVLLAAGAWVLGAVRGRARAALVLVIFAVVGALRPLLFLWAGAILGVPVEAGDLIGRVAINVVSVVATLSLIAAGVSLVHEHRGVFGRLRAAQEASAGDARCAAERIQELRHSAVDGVLDEIERAAAAVEADALRPEAAAGVLRRLAEEVVRPASHRLYDGVAVPNADASAEAVLRDREWWVSVAQGMRAAPPLRLALLFFILAAPFAILQYGLLASLLPLVAGLAVTWSANLLIQAAARASTGRSRTAVLLIGYPAAGLALATTGELVLLASGIESDLVWSEVAMYPIVALGVAFIASLADRTRRDQAALERAVQASVHSAARVRADFEHEREALARILHSGVQSELIATALALGTSGHEDPSAELRAVVDRIRAEVLRPREEPDPAARVPALLESWRSAIPLQTRIEPSVWDRLQEPARCAAVIDIVSEGLANSVRHGDGSPVVLQLRPDGVDGVEVVVVSGGRLKGAGPGIGLRQLAQHGSVALREAAGRVELAVTVP